jgi:hypothetical protein
LTLIHHPHTQTINEQLHNQATAVAGGKMCDENTCSLSESQLDFAGANIIDRQALEDASHQFTGHRDRSHPS